MAASAGRRLALGILGEVERKGAYADVAFERWAGGEADPRERAFAQELAYGVLRRRLTLDHHLGHCLRQPLQRLPVPIRNTLRLGAYELLYGGVAPYAAVSQAVELAKAHGHAGTVSLVNAVLRALSRGARAPFPDPDQDAVAAISLRESCPAWLVRRWLARLGREETEALCAALNQVPPLSGRCNQVRASPARLAERLAEEGVRTSPGRYRPECFRIDSVPPGWTVAQLPSFREGWFSLQDEGSALVAPVLNPQPGERVVDACSAPGTKTAHLLELMGGEGEVLAVDVHPHRLRLVEEGCARLGLAGGLRTRVGDARRLAELTEACWGAPADKILVDAPCSGLGALGRRPDLRWRRREEDLAALACLQREILRGAAEALGPGGILVYATCATEPEENQKVVEAFLAERPEFAPADLTPYLPPALRVDSQGHFLQLWPHRHGTDGFFICRLRKRR